MRPFQQLQDWVDSEVCSVPDRQRFLAIAERQHPAYAEIMIRELSSAKWCANLPNDLTITKVWISDEYWKHWFCHEYTQMTAFTWNDAAEYAQPVNALTPDQQACTIALDILLHVLAMADETLHGDVRTSPWSKNLWEGFQYDPQTRRKQVRSWLKIHLRHFQFKDMH